MCKILSYCLLLTLFSCVGCNTYVGRYFAWRDSNISDYRKFPSQAIQKGSKTFHFHPQTQNLDLDSIPYDLEGNTLSLSQLVDETQTTALLIIRNDSILLEAYGNGYNRESINTSFSVAKSLTSLLIGIAIDEGYLQDTQEPITQYLPELLDLDPRFANISIEHLLDMRSGMKFGDHNLPWGDRPLSYYHPNLRKISLKQEIESPSGNIWEYNTYHTILLGMILERSTGMNAAEYLEAKIWKKMGMEFEASWSIDSKRNRMVKMESGINLRAIDLAKFGKLLLEEGKFNGEPIISSNWIQASMFYDSQNALPPPFQATTHYEKSWWITEPTADYRYAVYGNGHHGQYVAVFPKENVICVRMGKKFKKVQGWIFTFNRLLDQIL